MKYAVSPVTASFALGKLSTLGGLDDSKLKVVFEENSITFSRADREHYCEFKVVAQGSGSATFGVDWSRLSNVLKNGVTDQCDVTLDYDPKAAHLVITQGVAIRVKLPVSVSNSTIPYAYSDEALQYDLEASTKSFFQALKMVSVFCVEKVVGRGKYPGIVVHGDRAVATSHEGALIASADLGFQDWFGLPYSVVWTLLGLASSDRVSVTFGTGAAPAGQLRAVFISGEFKEGTWLLKFPAGKPVQSFLGVDLIKPLVLSEFLFKARASVDHMRLGLAAAAAVQSKSDVWVNLTDISKESMTIKGSDTAETVNSAVVIPASDFEGGVVSFGLQVKKAHLQDILSQLDGDFGIGFDGVGKRLVFEHARGTALLSCNIVEEE